MARIHATAIISRRRWKLKRAEAPRTPENYPVTQWRSQCPRITARPCLDLRHGKIRTAVGIDVLLVERTMILRALRFEMAPCVELTLALLKHAGAEFNLHFCSKNTFLNFSVK